MSDSVWPHRRGSPPDSPSPGILQARTLEWVAISFSNAWKWKVKVTQLCPTLSDPIDCSLPVHGIFQARVLEGGAIAYSSTYLQNVLRIQPLLSLSKTPSPHHILPGSLEQPNDWCPCLCPCSLQFAVADIPKDIIMNEQDKGPCLLKSHFFLKN